jgi:hypothetical protein
MSSGGGRGGGPVETVAKGVPGRNQGVPPRVLVGPAWEYPLDCHGSSAAVERYLKTTFSRLLRAYVKG